MQQPVKLTSSNELNRREPYRVSQLNLNIGQ